MRTKKQIVERVELLLAMRDHPPVAIYSDEPVDFMYSPGTITYYPEGTRVEVLVDIPAINAEIAALTWVLNGK